MRDIILYAWLQSCIGTANRVASEILPRFGSIDELYQNEDFSFLGPEREKYIERLENKDTGEAFETAKRVRAVGAHVVGYYDKNYPSRLRGISDPPAALYVIGELRELSSVPCIAVVGARKMTEYGKNIAERFAYDFAKSGAAVISGLAKGIDTAAHRGAIAAGGYTVAVLGNPIGDVYPAENTAAFKTLYERGAVVSEMYPGCPRTRADFPNRNRIISGMCDVTVVAEAGEHSGALITAHHAVSQGRRVYAVPGAVGAANAGTNLLIKRGIPAATEPYDILGPLMLEYPRTVRVYEPSVTERLRTYGMGKPEAEKPHTGRGGNAAESTTAHESAAPKVNASERAPAPGREETLSEKIIAALNGGRMTADELAAKTGTPVSEVMCELTIMEIDGSIISAAGNRYTVRK